MRLKNSAFALLLISFGLVAVQAQTPLLSSTALEQLLAKADKATIQYTETFKNLAAQENKTFEDYDKNGNLLETRRVKSEFIVYETLDGVNEFRNVTEFNGSKVTHSDEEIKNLFVKLENAGSTTNESLLLRKEALRFDGKSSAWGMTLWQESPFGKVRPFFSFTIAGKEKLAGRDAYIVEYRQTKPTLLLKFNPTSKDWKKEPAGREYRSSVSQSLRPENARQFGKIWLDAETGQILRNELQVFIQPPQLSRAVTALELTYEYQPSQFKILVPKRFAYVLYKITGSGDKDLTVVKDRTMLFEYSNFKEFKTQTKEVKISDK